ncbi:MAG: hypothetical protein WBX01_14140 [Nitrososphaeraceae archaeon]
MVEPKIQVKNGSHTLGPTYYVGSYTSEDIRRDNRIRHEEGCLVKEEQALMPTTLATTVKHIHDRVPNPVNSQLIAEFHEFMKQWQYLSNH